MNRYVLEILDGDQAGTVVEAGATRLLIGRKPDCDLVLRDDKCSGHHAEIVFEDGRHVLRDLGSTNGTTLDGRPVQDVVLSPRDVFVLGRVRIVYRSADAAAAGVGDDADLQVGRVDASRLARTGQRRGSLVLTLLFGAVLIAGGLFAWRTFVADETVEGAGPARPITISGNRLASAAANFEAEGGWELQPVAAAVPFEVAVGRARANSGTSALAASGVAAEEGGGRAFALARLGDPIPVTSGQPVRVVAHLRSAGRGRGMIRAVFGYGDDPAYLRTGTAPVASSDGFRELSFTVRSPTGADRVAVELVALVPGPEDEVLFDDVGVLMDGEVAGIEGRVGPASVVGAGGSLRIEGPGVPVVQRVVPIVDGDPGLEALGREGLLVPSDAGLELAVATLPDSTGFRFTWSGEPVQGLALDLPPESASCRARTADGAFVPCETEFEAAGVREVLFGGADNRAEVRLAEPTTVRGEPRPGAWRLALEGAMGFDLRVVFSDEKFRARELVRRAEDDAKNGRPGAALESIDQIVAALPHDVATLRAAQELRASVIAAQQREIEALLSEAAEAEFFEARVGYQRVIAEIDDLRARYGEGRIARDDELTAARERMAAALAAEDAREREERAERLRALAATFEEVGSPELAEFVREGK